MAGGNLAAMSGGPRIVIAVSIAALLAVFLAYEAIHGSGQLLVSVAQLRSDKDGAAAKTVDLTGTAVRCIGGACSDEQAPFTFVVKDDGSNVTIPVRYASGSVPDAFASGRHVIITGKMKNGTFVAEPDSLITKCPSKYTSGPPSGQGA
jgi:cytochrome c-type biogenesis protein CcmE